MSFIKYQHIEKLGHQEVADILEGTVTIYPKLDGTNASVWMDLSSTPEIQAGSRNRHLEPGKDNAGFLAWAREHEGLKKFLTANPHLRLYGEWLVPHSLKTYREDAKINFACLLRKIEPR